MRFSSFLPMLLLVGAFKAYGQCSITDLTATASPFANASCEYFVTLDFQFSGTTNQYTVTGNGNNYGTFPYDTVPVVLGPFTAGNSPEVLEFVVTDATFGDCMDATEVQIPACPVNAACNIYDLHVVTGDCNPGSISYGLLLDFKVDNPGNDFFEVYAGNGLYLGLYPLSDLPLKFPVYPWNGDSIDQIKVCINDNPDCCETLEFPAPDCTLQPCNITGLEAVAGDCTSDSTYQLTLNFSLLAPNLLNQFGVFANGEFFGIFGINDLPISIDSFPWDGGPVDEVKVCILNSIDPTMQIICCASVEFDVPDCLPKYPCAIKDFAVETDTCSSDSTFGLWVNFMVMDSTAVDSFQVWANDSLFGTFAYDSLPLYIADFPWNGSVFNHVRVCTGNAPPCCKTLQFVAPDCLPFGPCEVTHIDVDAGPCTSDSTYKARINFQATNPGDGNFVLWANGMLIDTFPLDTAPLTITNFPWGGGDVDVIKICISGATPDTVPCCLEYEYHVPDCLFPDSCSISNVVLNALDCNPDNHTYSLHLDFDVANPGNDFFELWTSNGQYLGFFPLSQLPITLPNIPCNSTSANALKICINDHPDCCVYVDYQAPDCCASNPCEVSDLSVETGDCTSGETYEVWVNFQVSNPTGNQFNVFANGDLLGTFSLDSLPLYIPEFPWNGGQNDVIKICIAGDPAGANGCCKTLEFNVPGCLNQGGDCEIYDLVVDPGDCTGDSTYSITLNFQVANAPGNTFGVWANGQFFDTYTLDDLPLTIDNFPWNGGPQDVVKVCFSNNGDGCCKTKEFVVPACMSAGGPCELFYLAVETGDCTGDSTYEATINFMVNNPASDSFSLYANGTLVGNYSLDQLPVHISNFPWNGGPNDVVQTCMNDSMGVATDCCQTFEFPVPSCLNQGGPCEVYDLVVDPGDCTGDSTYSITLNFQVANPPGNTFGVWANGQFFDTYTLDDLPLTIDNFPWNGGPQDVVKVCFSNNGDGCCKTKEFVVPACMSAGGPCELFYLAVETGDCTGDSTYEATINFMVNNPASDSFSLYANGTFIGNFSLDQLPVHISDFPWNGGPHDVVQACMNDSMGVSTDCCQTYEFMVPSCLNQGGPCEVYNLVVDPGDCTGDSTYTLVVNFQVANAPADSFNLFANGAFFGTFALGDLPLTIQDFPWNGGPNDVVKVCFSNSCCRTKEFQVPGCLNQGGDCEVFYLAVETGDCTGDSTYMATINFMVNNQPSDHFALTVNGMPFGTYTLADLPLTINDFPWNGGPNDVVKVCMLDANNEPTNCCQILEFAVPSCLNPGTPCEIYDLVVDPGDCTGDSTYTLVVNFQVANAPADSFQLFANGALFGTFALADLPLTIQDFPWNGGQNDVVKVCFTNNPYGCCKTKEFAVPGCLNQGCEVYDLTVETGDCTGDSTYTVTINFQVDNPPGDQFGVWANGMFLGNFNLADLPLTIQDFPWNGGPNDVVKVCFSSNNGNVLCCRTKEFAVPGCVNQGQCNISDLIVIPTPCLCGQFFVAVTFHHENGGFGGFEIVGNGNNYGSFPYDEQQPIILGPFTGDGSTQFEFAVVDVQNQDCYDDILLGSINCMTPVVNPVNTSSLVLSPNPTASWLNVTAQLNGAVKVGEATVEIYHADGRLVLSDLVADGSNFQLDVSNLQAGLYRLTLLTPTGRLEGVFAKQ